MGGNQDHQLRLLMLIIRRAEERAENRDISKEREPRNPVLKIVLKKAGDRKALAVLHLDGGPRPADFESGDRHDAGVDRNGRIDLADFGNDLEIDQLLANNSWSKRKAYTEVLKGNRDN